MRLNGAVPQGGLGPAPPVGRRAVARGGPPIQYSACPKRSGAPGVPGMVAGTGRIPLSDGRAKSGWPRIDGRGAGGRMDRAVMP